MTTSAASALDNVMAEAEAAAAQAAPAPVQLPAVGGAAGLVPAAPANLNRPALEDFLDGGGMDVDTYLKVNAEGFRIGDKMQGLLEDVIVEIDMTEVTPIYQSRHEAGGKTTFLKTYDGQTTPEGKNFNAEFDRLSRLNVKNDGPFQTAEIPMTLVDDVTDPKKSSSVVIDAGTRVGLTPSKTGFRAFQAFGKQLRRNNPAALNGVLKVKLVHEKKTNTAGNEWGVINFELVEG
jgi:hypothetical protein